MPDGMMEWFDGKAGEGVVVRAGRSFAVAAKDVEPAARRPGVRVHFDIARARGNERAVNVQLRRGERVGAHHRRIGTLQGARRPEEARHARARAHPDFDRTLDVHPLELVRAFADAVARGDLVAVEALCAPDLVVHLDDGDRSGRARVQGWLEEHPAWSSGRPAEVRGLSEDRGVEATWLTFEPGAPVDRIRCRVRHGLVAELWPVTHPAGAPAGEAPPERPNVEIVVSGDVDVEAVVYAMDRIGQLERLVDEPVLRMRVKLGRDGNPALERPVVVQATIDINGDLLRAEVAAHTPLEAVDLLQQRLRDRIEHRARHNEALQRLSGHAEPGEWRHGDLPSEHLPGYDRPVDERELVRLKTYLREEETLDEAIFDMEQLGYRFYLFSDLLSGRDALVERAEDGRYQLTRLGEPSVAPGPSAYPVSPSPAATPALSVADAIEALNLSGAPYVFFENRATGRGNVCYRRYDGHYGLLAPA